MVTKSAKTAALNRQSRRHYHFDQASGVRERYTTAICTIAVLNSFLSLLLKRCGMA